MPRHRDRIPVRGVAWAVVSLLVFPAAAAEPLVGQATVIDGDTIEIHAVRIRLQGIDAPETRQPCYTNGKPWRCGQQAALALADKVAGRTVSCRPNGADRYGRPLAVCFIGREDVNAWLVSEGWALAYRAYSTAYVGEEEVARRGHRGIWRGDFEPPWEWRQRNRDTP